MKLSPNKLVNHKMPEQAGSKLSIYFFKTGRAKITYSRGRQSIQAYLVQGVFSLLRAMLKSIPLCVLKWELPGIYSRRKQEGFSLSTHSGDFGSE